MRAVLLAAVLVVGADAACTAGEVPWPAAGGGVTCEPLKEAQTNALAFLGKNAPPWDRLNEYTLFGAPGGVDGLEVGVASLGANATLGARAAYSWAAAVPRSTFEDYVLPYACVNEPRTDWHPLLAAAVDPILAALPGNASTAAVAAAINGYDAAIESAWDRLGGIVFKSSQTPLIFDPVSTVAYGYASCTGVSITFVAALRVAGVAARLVGTPAWGGEPANGNHNWVEIYAPETGRWSFIEAKPAGGGETLADPCDKWFCDPKHFPADDATKVFASRFNRFTNASIYEMAWDPTNLDVPGVDRTKDYFAMCSRC